MSSEVIVTLITAIAGIIVAAIQVKSSNKIKKQKEEVNSLKDNKEFNELKDIKRRAFDDREETYNELSLVIARYLLYQTDKNVIEQKLVECAEKDAAYRQATDRYVDAITKIAEKM